MQTTLKAQLIRRFITVIFLTSLISSVVGTLLISNWTIGQAQDRVRNSLNSARETLNHRLENIRNTIYFAAFRMNTKEGLLKKDRVDLEEFLENIRKRGGIDFLTITDKKGNVVLRTRNPQVFGDNVSDCGIIQQALSSKRTVSSIEIIPYEYIQKEGKEIALRCAIPLIETAKTKFPQKGNEDSAMVLISASPVLDNNEKVVGILFGGEILNRNSSIVDRVRDIVFQNEKYGGKDIGVVTIFLKGIRIATNYKNDDGSRAIGTEVSNEVYKRVIEEGQQWSGRALVIHDWYVTCYEPIRNQKNERIGILAAGMPEQKFADMRRETLFIFLGITLLGMALSLFIANFFSSSIVKPIAYLRNVSSRISQGDLSAKVEVRSINEIAELERTFDRMASSLQKREEEIRKLTEQHLMRSEKLASIGRLAAGIAHEINNPLTSVLTFSSLLLRKAEESQREKLEIIVKETTRCREIVRGLLNFARQSEPKKELCEVNRIIEGALSLTKNQLKVSEKKISVETELGDLPSVHIDPNQMLEVFVNIIINAVDAMPQGGTIRVHSARLKGDPFIEIRFSDTGCGISKENLEKIFDPFFTTKEAGKGTGLGLAVIYGIVERHNGSIDVESEVGKGTTFIVKLPME